MALVSIDHLPIQQDFYLDETRLLAYVGGIGTGKSYVGADKMLEKFLRYPMARKFIFSNTFPQLKSGTMQTFFARCRHWGIEYQDRIRDKYVRLHKRIGRRTIEGKIETWTADDHELFRSLEIDFAWIDEGHVWDRLDFLTLLGRLRGFEMTRQLYGDIGQQLWITANPPHTTDHWLVEYTTKPAAETDEIMDLLMAIEQEQHPEPDAKPPVKVSAKKSAKPVEPDGEEAEEEPKPPPIKLYTSSTFDNPYLPVAYVRTLLQTMDPELVDIELKGNFGDIGKGKIWRAFSRGKHIVTPRMAQDYGIPALEWDPNSEVCWSQDFNIDPLCTVLFQWRRVKAPGFQEIVMYVLDEMRIRSSLIRNAAEEFANRTLPFEIAKRNGLILYGDPAGNQGNRQTGESDWVALRKSLRALGLDITRRVPEAAPRRRDRYYAGNAKLVDGTGRIGCVIHPRCQHIAIDINTFFYKPGTSEPLVKKTEDGATNTHFSDAWSYPIAEDFPIVASSKQY